MFDKKILKFLKKTIDKHLNLCYNKLVRKREERNSQINKRKEEKNYDDSKKSRRTYKRGN